MWILGYCWNLLLNQAEHSQIAMLGLVNFDKTTKLLSHPSHPPYIVNKKPSNRTFINSPCPIYFILMFSDVRFECDQCMCDILSSIATKFLDFIRFWVIHRRKGLVS